MFEKKAFEEKFREFRRNIFEFINGIWSLTSIPPPSSSFLKAHQHL